MDSSHGVFPRYFVAASEGQLSPVIIPGWIAGVVRLPGPTGAMLERVVAVTLDGAMTLLDPDGLPSALRRQLARHELARRRPALEIHSDDLWLCELHGLEERPDDPASLLEPASFDATLTGPFPHGPIRRARGSLTVARADLLQGLIRGHDCAFLATDDDSAPLEGHRCFGAVIPGDRLEAISVGRGILLAYPALPPAELKPVELVNEAGCRTLVWELLGAARLAAEKAGEAEHPLLSQPLPVASREEAEARFRAAGFTIEGDLAVKRVAGRGLLAGILGRTETVEIPPEGAWETFLSLAKEVLAATSGWPDGRANALSARLGPAARFAAPNSAAIPRDVPREAQLSRPPTPPRPRQAPGGAGHADRGDWMADFAEPMRPGGERAQRPPRGTRSASNTGSASAEDTTGRQTPGKPASGKPASGKPASGKPASGKPASGKPASGKPADALSDGNADKPDWMKDFE